MAEPLLGSVAAIAELTVLVKDGIKAVVRRQPEYHFFWNHFERQLKPEFRDVPWQRIEKCFWLDPEFIGLACKLIRGEREALKRLEQLFEDELEPPEGSRYDKHGVVSTVLTTARESASEAVKDFKAAARQTTGLLEGRIDEAEVTLTDEVRAGTSQVVRGQQQLSEQIGALHARVEELAHERREGEGESERLGASAAAQMRETQPLPSLSERADNLRTPEEMVDALSAEDELGAERLRVLLDEGGTAAVVTMIRGRQRPDAHDSLPYLVTAARIAAHAGAFPEAEDAYAWASQLPELDDGARARQLVRAAAMARLHSGEPRFRDLLEEAKRLAPEHPGIAIAEARASNDANWTLHRIAAVRPENDAEAALLHITRAQAQLALEDEPEAERELAEARSADAESIAVREFENILPLVVAERRIGRGEQPDHGALRLAADGLQALRTGLDRQARWDESAQLAARAAEAYALAADQDAAVGVLESVKHVDRLSEGARTDLSRSALISRRPDLVVKFLAAEDQRPEARLLRADAQALGGDADARHEAVATLSELLDEDDEEIQRNAAFALLAAAASERDVVWSDKAAKLVAAAKPLTAAVLRAEHLRLHGDLEAAERELLPHSDRLEALRLLRDYAIDREDWERAKDRSRTLMRGEPTPPDRLANAEILRHSGEIGPAREEFLSLARDENAVEGLREAAFGAVTEIVGEARDYPRVKEVAAEWHDALPASANGLWNLVFALARTGQHPEAYKLLQETEPEPNTLQQAQLMAEILYRAAPKVEAIQRIEQLSSRFGQEEQLEAVLIMTLLELDEHEHAGLPGDLLAEVKQRFESFTERFPNSKVLWKIDAPQSAEEFDALMREMHGESAEWQRRIQDDVAAGRAPVNALAVVSPVSQVGTAWGKMTALPLGFSITALDEHERAVAGQAVGGAAVWDPSSIFVVGGLGEEIEHRMRASLPGSLIVQETLEDADLAATGPTAAKPPTATAGYDPESGQAFIREISAEEAELDRRRVEGMLRIAKELHVEPARGEDLDEKLAAVLADEDVDRAWTPFIGTFLLAQRTKRPIFSDDRWIRQFAREHGVEAFGTVALLDAMTDQGVVTRDQRRVARLRLAASGSWGLNLTSDEIIEAARASDWDVTSVLAGALRDRAAWRGRPAERFRELVVFLQAVFDEAPMTFRLWVRRAIDAAQRAMPHMHLSWSAQSLLLIAWGLHESDRPTSDPCFHALVEEVKSLPPSMTTLGFDAVLGALDAMLLQFNGEPDRLRFAVFTLATRRLRFPDHFRAWKTFVEGFSHA